jgi:hypothetical protein
MYPNKKFDCSLRHSNGHLGYHQTRSRKKDTKRVRFSRELPITTPKKKKCNENTFCIPCPALSACCRDPTTSLSTVASINECERSFLIQFPFDSSNEPLWHLKFGLQGDLAAAKAHGGDVAVRKANTYNLKMRNTMRKHLQEDHKWPDDKLPFAIQPLRATREAKAVDPLEQRKIEAKRKQDLRDSLVNEMADIRKIITEVLPYRDANEYREMVATFPRPSEATIKSALHPPFPKSAPDLVAAQSTEQLVPVDQREIRRRGLEAYSSTDHVEQSKERLLQSNELLFQKYKAYNVLIWKTRNELSQKLGEYLLTRQSKSTSEKLLQIKRLAHSWNGGDYDMITTVSLMKWVKEDFALVNDDLVTLDLSDFVEKLRDAWFPILKGKLDEKTTKKKVTAKQNSLKHQKKKQKTTEIADMVRDTEAAEKENVSVRCITRIML